MKIHSLNLELCFLGALVLNFQKGLDFPGGSLGKNSPTNAGDTVQSWVVQIPWRRRWQPTPVFFPGESRGRRSLAGAAKSETQLSS